MTLLIPESGVPYGRGAAGKPVARPLVRRILFPDIGGRWVSAGRGIARTDRRPLVRVPKREYKKP